VCGKGAAELEAAAARGPSGAARPSFVFAIECCTEALRQYPAGWVREAQRAELAQRIAAEGGISLRDFTNLNDSPRPKEMDLAKDEPMPKNVHGASEFVVKVQVPTSAVLQGGGGVGEDDGRAGGCAPGLPSRCMVYDRRKTFGGQFFDCDSPARRRAFAMVRQSGAAGGLKAYFMAQRQGSNVRVFTDRAVPTPEPPW
jgi:hypothetical protein